MCRDKVVSCLVDETTMELTPLYISPKIVVKHLFISNHLKKQEAKSRVKGSTMKIIFRESNDFWKRFHPFGWCYAF
jgi:hypothetical protein